MPTLAEYEATYGAPDRDEVLDNIRKYGTDDRSKWGVTAAPATPSPPPQTASGPSGSFGAPNNATGTSAPSATGFSSTPSNSWDRTAFRDAWMSSGVQNVNDMKNWLANSGWGQHVGIGGSKNDQFILPGGERIDAVLAAGLGGNRAGPQWTGVAGYGGGGGGGMSGLAGGTGGMPPGMSGLPYEGYVPPGTGASGDLRSQIVNQLLQRSQQSLYDKNDPAIRAQADSYSADVERQKRNYLADLAEKAGPGANLRGEQRVANERAGQAVGKFSAGLIGEQINARRQEIAQALQMLQGQLTSEQEMSLRRELASMDDATKRLGIDVQREGLGLDWRKALLQNDQFGRDLGLRAEDRYNYWDAVNRGLF